MGALVSCSEDGQTSGDRARRDGAPPGSGAQRGEERRRKPASPPRLAILDRDAGLMVSLTKRLDRLGWKHRVLPARASAKLLNGLEADVLVVDLDLVGEDRWGWLRGFIRRRPDMLVVICTERSTVSERVAALRVGAADWLTKPYHPDELIARVEAVSAPARRFQTRAPELSLLGGLEIRPDSFQVFVEGRDLKLTRKEYGLLELLVLASGRIESRERLYEGVWERPMPRDDRSVDVVVYRLRRKLEAAAPAWRYVHTHYGAGYRLAAEPAEDSEDPAPARNVLAA